MEGRTVSLYLVKNRFCKDRPRIINTLYKYLVTSFRLIVRQGYFAIALIVKPSF